MMPHILVDNARERRAHSFLSGRYAIIVSVGVPHGCWLQIYLPLRRSSLRPRKAL